MNSEIIFPLLALLAGVSIGYPFGLLQTTADKQRDGKPTGKWPAFLSGKGARITYLILTLVVIQLTCPFFFVAAIRWWVSGGVMLGYGWTLCRQISLRLKEAKK